VVLATGAWTHLLARDLGLRLPLEGAKGYHVEFPSSDATPRLPVFLYDAKVAVTPYPDRVRFSGTLELDGLDLRVDPRRIEAIVEAGTRAFPGVDGAARTHLWRGLRPASPDGLPIVGRVDGMDNATVVTGHGTAGMTLGPATAELAADLITGRPPAFDTSALAPGRFGIGTQAREVLRRRGARAA
jgi:D-amino-acid dehydrogenase